MRVPVREVLFKIILKIEINLKNASFPPGEVETSFELNEHWDHSFSTYAKFSEKLFLPPDSHTYVFVSGGKKCKFFGKFLRTY